MSGWTAGGLSPASAGAVHEQPLAGAEPRREVLDLVEPHENGRAPASRRTASGAGGPRRPEGLSAARRRPRRPPSRLAGVGADSGTRAPVLVAERRCHRTSSTVARPKRVSSAARFGPTAQRRTAARLGSRLHLPLATWYSSPRAPRVAARRQLVGAPQQRRAILGRAQSAEDGVRLGERRVETGRRMLPHARAARGACSGGPVRSAPQPWRRVLEQRRQRRGSSAAARRRSHRDR
jgi:hypothetical protein